MKNSRLMLDFILLLVINLKIKKKKMFSLQKILNFLKIQSRLLVDEIVI